MTEIQAATLYTQIKAGEKLRLIDVRTPREYQRAHIACSENLPVEKISAEDLASEGGEKVILICASGDRAARAKEILGCAVDSVCLDGGMTAWKDAHLPLVRPSAKTLLIDQQAYIIALVLAITGVILTLTVSPFWVFLAAMPAVGLTVAAMTDICLMKIILQWMPWNRTNFCYRSQKQGIAERTKC